MKWTKRSETQHPLPYSCMGDLVRFKREDVDRWAQEEAARRKAENNKKKLQLAS
jgi:predicted DNA-binding transcriptional regulator AlpA